MLILAGVSINLVIGNNGIITKAGDASNKTKIANVKDKISLIIGEWGIEKYTGTGTLKDFLDKKVTDEGTTLYITFAHSIEGGTTTVSPTLPFAVTQNGTYTFTVTGTVNGETSSKTQASNRVLTVTQTGYYNIAFKDSNKYYDEAGAVLTASNSYWVASRYASCYSDRANFGLRSARTYMGNNSLFNSGGGAYAYSHCLRPVVSLSSSLLSSTKDSNGHWNLK